MTRLAHGVALALLLVPMSASAPVGAAEAAPPAAAAPLLREFPTGSGRVLRAALVPCERGSCPVEITLLQEGRVLSAVRAPLAHVEAQLSRQHVSRGQGAGDPLEAPDLDAWTSGSGERAFTTTLRPLELKGGTPALLVTQFGGKEPKPVHALFIVRGDGVVRVWESAPAATSGSARHYSTTVIPPERPTEDLFLFQGLQSRDDTQPDALEAIAFRWDATRGRMTRGPTRGRVHVLAVGEFPSAKVARGVREAASDCLQDYWVLPGRRTGKKPAFTLTVMTTRKDLVFALANNVRECAPQLRQMITRPP